MAAVVIVTNPDPIMRMWDIPSGADDSLVPRGEVVFAGNQTLIAKVAIDETLWTMPMVLPRNFVYRVVDARVMATANDSGTMTDFGAAMRISVSHGDVLIPDWFFVLERIQAEFPFTISAGTNWSEFFEPGANQKVDAPINANRADATLLLEWVDISADITAQVIVWFHFRALIYDVTQARKWPMHTPVPIIGS